MYFILHSMWFFGSRNTKEFCSWLCFSAVRLYTPLLCGPEHVLLYWWYAMSLYFVPKKFTSTCTVFCMTFCLPSSEGIIPHIIFPWASIILQCIPSFVFFGYVQLHSRILCCVPSKFCIILFFLVCELFQEPYRSCYNVKIRHKTRSWGFGNLLCYFK